MEPTKTCLFKTPKHFMSEFMIELCEVTLNPKQQTWVQRENKAMERKIKLDVYMGKWSFLSFLT